MDENMELIYKEILGLSNKLEDYFKDMCHFDFTIENGHLFVLNAGVPRRSDTANIRCTLDFLDKGKIDLNEALSRISPENVWNFLRPGIANLSELKLIGNGFPASSGVATGIIVFGGDEISDLPCSKYPYILVKDEISPEDIELALNSKGILTTRGGMTSHAACVSRGMSKPCICGCMDITIDNGSIISNSIIVKSGEYITIDGDTGKIYLGKGNINKINWREKEELAILAKMIESAIRSNGISNDNIGHCWRIRDFFLHNMPLISSGTSKKPIKGCKNYISFIQPDNDTINEFRECLYKLSDIELFNYKYILHGIFRTLSRILSNNVGIGNHYKFFRPLLDPMQTIYESRDGFIQLVAIEFFDISKYVPFLIDIFNIKLIFELEANNDSALWFIDNTNFKGESIIDRTDKIMSYRILVNNAEVSHEDLPLFYNCIRKREYFWKWYQINNTSYKEILSFMKMNKNERLINFELCIKVNELGLMDGNNITEAGSHLIY